MHFRTLPIVLLVSLLALSSACDGDGDGAAPAADTAAAPATDVLGGTDAGVVPDTTDDDGLPASFLLGAATAGFQVDMGCPTLPAEECTDAASDWYAYVNSPEMQDSPLTYLRGRDPAITGPGHWELFEEDFDRLSDELHGTSYRMSVEWSRVFPTSTEGVEGHEALRAVADPAALATYHAMFDALRARGLTPLVTLHHYTLPLWIHDGVGCHADFAGCTDRGWVDPDRLLPEIEKYAGFVAREFGDDVDWWATQNEPFAVVVSGWLQPTETRSNPPALLLNDDAARTGMESMIRAHGRMYDAVHAGDKVDADGDGATALVGIVHAMTPVVPQDPTEPLDVAAAENVFYIWNLVFLDATSAGVLDMDLDGVGELDESLTGRMDYIGLNYKQTLRVEGAAQSFLPDMSPLLTLNPFTMDLSQVHPRGIVEMTRLLRDRYDRPVVITENNGQALWQDDEELEARRLVELMQWVERGVAEGLDLRGWFYWSLIDNYEWNHGMGIHLGLYSIDPDDPTKTRTARGTVDLLARIFAARGVPADLAAQYPIDPSLPPTGGVPDRFCTPAR